MPQDHERVIVGLLLGAADLKLSVDHRRRAEQLQRLIDQMRAEVEQHAAAVRRRGTGLPRLGNRRRPALEAGLEARYAAQGFPGQQLADSQEIAVPAPVVEHREHPAQPLSQGDQLPALGGADSERLVHHNVQSRLQRRLRQRKMGGGRGPQHHEVKVTGELKDSIAVAHCFDARVPLRRRSLPAGVGRCDDVQRVAGVRRNERRVEDAAREAIADDGSPDRAFRFSRGHRQNRTPDALAVNVALNPNALSLSVGK